MSLSSPHRDGLLVFQLFFQLFAESSFLQNSLRHNLRNTLHHSRLMSLLVGASTVLLVGNRPTAALTQAQTHPSAEVAQRNSNQTPTTPTQRTIWVNAQAGNDHKADGSEQAPFRTLTRALESVRPNTVIQLAAGTYSTETGEVFPIVLKPGVTVQGNPDHLGQGIVIRGGGSYSSPTLGRQNVTLVGDNRATLTGVTVTNPTMRGHGLWIEVGSPTIRHSTFINSRNAGVVITGSSTAIVEHNLFVLNRGSGLVISGHAQPEVRQNTLQRTGSGITITENAAPQIVSNRVSQNRDGIVVQGNAHPLLRSNTIEDNDRDGLIVIAQAQPNLGTNKEPGNNSFINNRQHDINALATNQILPAYGNQIAADRLTGEVDLTGKAPLISVTTIASAADRLPATQVPRSPQPSTRSRPTPAPTTASQTTAPSPSLISSLPPARPQPQTSDQTNPQSSSPAQAQTNLPISTPNNFLNRGQSNPQTNAQTNSRPNRSVVLASATTAPTRSTNSVPILVPAPETTAPAAINLTVPPPERPSAQSPLPASRPTRNQPLNQTLAASTQTARAIEIAVPPPERPQTVPTTASQVPPQLENVVITVAASLPRQNFAATRPAAPTLGGTPINIPVPPPERTAARVSTSSSSSASNSAVATRILPVPAGEIPLGNTSGMAKISIGDSSRNGTLLARHNLQFRVVVETADESAQSLVQSLVPGAFVTSFNGQSVIQIGAFSSRENAEAAVEMLSRSGLRGIIQPME